MLRTFSIFTGFVMLLGAGFAVAAWPHASAAPSGYANDEVLLRAYARVQTGMPASQLAAAGLDTAKAERLSKLALIEKFMPKDSIAFDALDPAVQDCYVGREDCNAYIFSAVSAQAILLVEGGRVAWKAMNGVRVAKARAKRVAGI